MTVFLYILLYSLISSRDRAEHDGIQTVNLRIEDDLADSSPPPGVAKLDEDVEVKPFSLCTKIFGLARLELATPCPPDMCATQLRHSPPTTHKQTCAGCFPASRQN